MIAALRAFGAPLATHGITETDLPLLASALYYAEQMSSLLTELSRRIGG